MRKSIIKRLFAGTLSVVLMGCSMPLAAGELVSEYASVDDVGGEFSAEDPFDTFESPDESYAEDEELIDFGYTDEIEVFDEVADGSEDEDLIVDLTDEEEPAEETELLLEEPDEETLSEIDETEVLEDDELESVDLVGGVIKSGKCGDNLSWTFTDAGLLTISGTGNMWDFLSESDIPWWGFRKDIVKVTVQSGVTRIGRSAFSDCGLKEMTFSGNAPTFGDLAFYQDTLTVYYPWQKSGWTEEVRQQYGGTVTWIPTPSIKPAPAVPTVYNSKSGGDIHWKQVTGAVGYAVYRFRSAEGTTRVATINSPYTLQCYDTSIRDNCYGRVYHYYVKARFNENGKTVEGPASEKAVLQRLAPMQITSVVNNASRTVTANWKCTVNENKSTGYEVSYASDYYDLINRTGTYKTVTINSRNTLSTTIRNLTNGNIYWIRMRSYVMYTNSQTGKQTKTWSQFSNIISVLAAASPGNFKNVSDAYTALNSFRTNRANQWYWNSSNTAKITTYGLKSLTRDPNLESVAKLRAMEAWTLYYQNGMATHIRPNGTSCFTAYPPYMFSVGENLAWGYQTSRNVIDGWAETNYNYSGQGHRRNMLDSGYTRVGIACYGNGYQTCWAMCLGSL